MPLTRRDFLRLVGGASLAAPFLGLPRMAAARADTRGWLLTTLARTIEQGEVLGTGTQGSYHRLRYGPGEPYTVRQDLVNEVTPAVHRRSMLNFVHHTDTQLADPQSPGRVEFLDRFSDRDCKDAGMDLFTSAQRPQEAIHFQAFEAMLRTVRIIGSSPVTGQPFRFAICTGDNIDNTQFNELKLFLRLMNGGTLDSNSGGPEFEGVQAASWGTPDLGPDPEYWHPDPAPDKYKQQWGFPDYPGLLDQAITPFEARGARMPWYSCNGNHDTLMQGNAPPNPAFSTITVGPLKVTGTPPGVNPCDQLETFITNPEGFMTGGGRLVTPDADRRPLTRREYVEGHFETGGRPEGHGFTEENRRDGTAYYIEDRFRRVRMITLDTTNPGGHASGSIGAAQMAWFEERLIEVHSRYYSTNGTEVETGNRDRLVVIFSHHGLSSMDNPLPIPDPFQPDANDLPRFNGPAIEALVHRFPNVILWVNGHSHVNRIRARPDPAGRSGGFWDVTTAAVCDWPTQSRLVELVENGTDLLSIFCTAIDHGAPPDPSGSGGVEFLASVHRELAANDPQKGIKGGAHGAPTDRNVELLIRAPFPLSGRAAARQERRRVPAGS